MLVEKQPRYILFKRTDDANGWTFMAYVPDNAKVKQKMLYAATRATVKKQLGSANFSEEMYSSDINDFTRHATMLTAFVD